MNPNTVLELPAITQLAPRVQRQIAAILAAATSATKPIMIGLADAADQLEPVLRRGRGGILDAFRDSRWPQPDLWQGHPGRLNRFVRIPVYWLDRATEIGPRAFLQYVPRPAILAGLAPWPDPMMPVHVAEALSSGRTSIRSLIDAGVLPTVKTARGQRWVKKADLVELVYQAVKVAVDSHKAGE